MEEPLLLKDSVERVGNGASFSQGFAGWWVSTRLVGSRRTDFSPSSITSQESRRAVAMRCTSSRAGRVSAGPRGLRRGDRPPGRWLVYGERNPSPSGPDKGR